MSLIKLASMPKGPHLELPVSHLKEDHEEIQKMENKAKEIEETAKKMKQDDKEAKKKYYVKSEKDEHKGDCK